MKRNFKTQGIGSFSADSIQSVGVFKSCQDGEEDVVICLKSGRLVHYGRDSIGKVYVRSSTHRAVAQFEGLGVYESTKRNRVIPYVVCSDFFGINTIIGYYEILTGKSYYAQKTDFVAHFEQDKRVEGHGIDHHVPHRVC